MAVPLADIVEEDFERPRVLHLVDNREQAWCLLNAVAGCGDQLEPFAIRFLLILPLPSRDSQISEIHG